MKLIVFDFDGVIADSEMLANGVLAGFLTELGVPMSVEESMQTFMGKRAEDLIATVAALNPAMPGAQFAAELTQRTLARFRRELREIAGVRDYLAAFPQSKRCIASSSSPERLAACLDILDLAEAFGEHVYSASMVPRGKPHPDLFLHAAARLGVAPSDAIVIEDSEGGVRAAVAAGMTPIGFLAASHVRAGDEARLRAAGAAHVARSYAELETITRGLAR
ncbi:MAG TPA: HAD-IA family hydrolase [Casimicrobiaceae bacterium]|jgi:HAD superfamily hydrolase (TIGR01509 family)|nr:HAD-IA family hydrolase [Casimicrobiaceae bacterium]